MNFTQQLWSVKEWGRVMATRSEYVTIVHEATNDEKWGPTGPQMDAVCNAYPRGGPEILNELRSRLNNRDKSWRPCYKSLLVIDHLARNVDDRYLPEICALVPLIRTISTSFYYTNPKGVDHGVSVRERAKKVADLLSDGLQLREERMVAAQIKEKLSHNASDGGGPNSGSPYSGAGGYGGFYSGGYGGSRDRDRHRSYGKGSRQAYDSYRSSPPPATVLSRPRTKEEQERCDMEMALRLQRDEERRSGVSAEQLEEMYATKVRQRQNEAERQKVTAEDDERLAMRLQQEEEERARREGVSLPTLNSDKPSSTPVKAPLPNPPATNALEELFAPPLFSQPAVAAPASSADPFDSFLDSRSGLAPQQNSWGQPQQQPSSVQNQWGQPQTANDAWGAPQQWPQQSVPPLQQPVPPLQQPVPPLQQQQFHPWGQSATVSTSNSWGQPQQGPSQQQRVDNNGSAGSWGQAPPPQLRDPWGQPQQQQQPQPQQPPQSSNSWGKFYQQPQPGHWGQTSAPPAQLSDTWGQPPASNTARALDSSNSGGNLGNMWGALDQFSNQQQHK
ncbi:putative epsin [Leishmania infantum JPCM5]|uniref:Epsin_-_putative n=2 Tax=Leishmania infantum TaxID=5671 RepID=A0A6L0XGN1_LEIIN|nr:putative epsin [Leishmania infantum JPCM5]CAC9493724.1 epsin_-_putative [Leishmania infantum]CAM68536.1 putative epsin [Leishmania infantum JPCM5]SUZ42391.1 epsin_-_putative [Leishmania infantum]|eukprot:XP_001466099.1 putative epsin [Leishmania infantum JPCM5]